MNCPNCGAEHTPGSTHCQSCGVPIEDAHSESTIEASPRSSNYFIRHWRGELPLPHAFWVNFVLVNAITAIIFLIISQSYGLSQSSRVLTLLAVTISGYALFIWQAVGTWRSASRWRITTGNGGWSAVAKGVIIFGLLNTFTNLDETAQFMSDGVKLAFYDKKFEKFAVSVSADKKVLLIQGALGDGITEQAQALLDQQPRIKTVSLNSPGGRVREGRALGLLIKSRQLKTYTDRGCFSACTLAYAGGKERLLHPDAKLGFHQYSNDYKSFGSNLKQAQEQDKRWFIDNGVSYQFTKNMFREESEEIWQPSRAEVMQSGLVHKIKKLTIVSRKGLDMTIVNRLDDAITQPKALDVIGRVFADQAHLLNQTAAAMAGKDVENAFSTTSNEAAVSFTHALVQRLETLKRSDAQLCVQTLYPSHYGMTNPDQHLGQETLFGLNESARKVIQDADSRPGKTPKESDAEISITNIMIRLTALKPRLGPGAINSDEEHQRICNAHLTLYRAVLALRKEDAGVLLRHSAMIE